MADSDGDHVGGTTTSSFSQLLFSDDDVGLDISHAFHYSSSSSSSYSSSSALKPPKMLCFGGYYKNQYKNQESDNNNSNNNVVLVSEPSKTTHQKSGVTCSDSSSASSVTTTITFNDVDVNVDANTNNGSKSNRKRNGTGQEPAQRSATIAKTPLTSQGTSKKAKMENPFSTNKPKVRREKLGERIAALQQLVSPFGKTDTASVLHEAMGYIKFLQDQVQVLCSPYLQYLPEPEENGEETRKYLKSRGLCLFPVEFTVHVASSNGADYWSPAMGNNFSPSSSTKQ